MSALSDALDHLRAAVDAGRANLLALESTPTVELLDAASLTGTTRAAWAKARTDRASLWAGLRLLADLLDDVEQQRRRRVLDRAARDAALLEQLRAPDLGLTHEEIPWSARDLFDPARPTRRCTPDEFVDVIARRYDHVRDLVARVTRVWETTVGDLASMRATLDRAAPVAGVPVDGDLATRLDALTTIALADPLAVDEPELRALTIAIDELDRRAGDALALQSQFPARVSAARARLADLADDVATARDACAHAATRFAGPAPRPPGQSTLDALAARLDDAVAGVANGNWSAAADALAQWERDCSHAAQVAEAATSAATEQLAIRSELRGRLDAYSALAAALGLAEDDDAETTRLAAEDALYRAPCDLATATALVGQYQRLLGPVGDRVEVSEDVS